MPRLTSVCPFQDLSNQLFELPSNVHPNYRSLPWPVMLSMVSRRRSNVGAIDVGKTVDASVVLLWTAREVGSLAGEQWKKVVLRKYC